MRLASTDYLPTANCRTGAGFNSRRLGERLGESWIGAGAQRSKSLPHKAKSSTNWFFVASAPWLGALKFLIKSVELRTGWQYRSYAPTRAGVGAGSMSLAALWKEAAGGYCPWNVPPSHNWQI